jgi:hypothetical protein
MALLYKSGPIEIWCVPEVWGTDYWVYGITKGGDPLVCPSLSLARARVA